MNCSNLTTVQDTVIYFMKTRGITKQEAIELVESKLRVKIPEIIRNLIPEVPA